jgi:hypothetical protein
MRVAQARLAYSDSYTSRSKSNGPRSYFHPGRWNCPNSDHRTDEPLRVTRTCKSQQSTTPQVQPGTTAF